MTRDEVRFLLGRVRAAYELKPPTAEVVDEWDRALRPYFAADGHAALDQLIGSGARPPNLATFVAHVKARQPPPVRVLPDPPPDSLFAGPTQRGRELIAKAKCVLRHPSTQEDR